MKTKAVLELLLYIFMNYSYYSLCGQSFYSTFSPTQLHLYLKNRYTDLVASVSFTSVSPVCPFLFSTHFNGNLQIDFSSESALNALLRLLRCESVVVLSVSICICDCMMDGVFLQFLFVVIAMLPLNYCRMIEKYMTLFFICMWPTSV